ncbi:hypothetical protein SNEBB_001962 [Seison nebaliae]|nr:hypothetical protein SNEBB_001962 [Seison nebaliae]
MLTSILSNKFLLKMTETDKKRKVSVGGFSLIFIIGLIIMVVVIPISIVVPFATIGTSNNVVVNVLGSEAESSVGSVNNLTTELNENIDNSTISFSLNLTSTSTNEHATATSTEAKTSLIPIQTQSTSMTSKTIKPTDSDAVSIDISSPVTLQDTAANSTLKNPTALNATQSFGTSSMKTSRDNLITFPLTTDKLFALSEHTTPNTFASNEDVSTKLITTNEEDGTSSSHFPTEKFDLGETNTISTENDGSSENIISSPTNKGNIVSTNKNISPATISGAKEETTEDWTNFSTGSEDSPSSLASTINSNTYSTSQKLREGTIRMSVTENTSRITLPTISTRITSVTTIPATFPTTANGITITTTTSIIDCLKLVVRHLWIVSYSVYDKSRIIRRKTYPCSVVFGPFPLLDRLNGNVITDDITELLHLLSNHGYSKLHFFHQ